jgi:hypothetical protein
MASETVTVCVRSEAADIVESLGTVLAPFDINAITDLESFKLFGRWDSWIIFGGDGDEALRVKPGFDGDPRIVWNPQRGNGTPRMRFSLRCDGGPRGLLDFEAAEDAATGCAAEQWDQWATVTRDLPLPTPLTTLLEQSKLDPVGYPTERAYSDHASQLALLAWSREFWGSAEVKYTEWTDPAWSFRGTRADYIRRAVIRAVPTSALLTLDGRWIDMTVEDGLTAQDSYYEYASHHLNTLDDDTFVVRIRAHY